MKKKDVEVGGVYLAKVSDRLVEVKILSSGEGVFSHRTTWTARNLATGREVHIRSPQRLRRRLR